MVKNIGIAAAFALVLIFPMALHRGNRQPAAHVRTLVIITPHNEATRYEFSHAFEEYYFKKTGQPVHIDWRTPGGTSEIARYLESEYLGAFQNYWSNHLHRQWDAKIKAGFANANAPLDDSPAGEARKEFLNSDVGCGIDLLFGGGSFDFEAQAAAGRLVDSGVLQRHPDLFTGTAIPQTVGGESYWDPQGRWIGTCLASFGICYNADILHFLKIVNPPKNWSDLADPAYFGSIALGNPAQSGSVAKAFEMLIQQQILAEGRGSPEVSKKTSTSFHDAKMRENTGVAPGWIRAMQLIRKISANARYFTDSGTKVPFDVEAGDAAAGMCIDFYGRFESEAVRSPDGSSRIHYITPAGGSSFGADPIGMLRGAPNADLAREFIEYVISLDGQALWNWKVGVTGGPVKYALRRLPIRPELYAPLFNSYRSDPDIHPFSDPDNSFEYHASWTSPLFRTISFIIRAMCIDSHEELKEAWRTLVAAHFPPQASVVFNDVSKVDYNAARSSIQDALHSPNKIEEVKLAKILCESFRAQYRQAAELAREGK